MRRRGFFIGLATAPLALLGIAVSRPKCAEACQRFQPVSKEVLKRFGLPELDDVSPGDALEMLREKLFYDFGDLLQKQRDEAARLTEEGYEEAYQMIKVEQEKNAQLKKEVEAKDEKIKSLAYSLLNRSPYG